MKYLFLASLLAAAPLKAELYQKIVAKVGSEIVTSFDVESAVRVLEASMSDAEKASPEGRKKIDEARAKVLDRMIEEKLVVLAAEKGPDGYKEAVERGTAGNNPYVPTSQEVEEEVDKTFEDARARMGGEEVFAEELKRERISASEFRQRLRERLRSQMTFQRMIKNKEKEFQPLLRVSDDEAKAFYDEHKASFAVGDQVNLRHIQFVDKAPADAALNAIKAAKKPKDEFIRICRKESKDELSADQGGRLGWVEKGGLRWKGIEALAFSMSEGRVDGPVKSDEGWHLLWVDEKKPGEQKSLDEVKAQVRNMVYQKKSQARIEQWVEDLKKEFYVERAL